MIAIVLVVGMTAVAVAVMRLAARAVAAEHLVLLRTARGVVLFERGGDGVYHPLPLHEVPAALCRFSRGIPAVARARANR
jgi:hypothetical protein